MFDTDFEAADDAFAEAFGTTVTIERSGAAPTEEVTAEVVLRDYEVENDAGMPELVQFRDYLIAVADYQVAGVAVEPQRGDLLRQTIAGQACEFTLLPAGKRPAAEWADAGHSRWLIHTKKTA